MAKKRKAVIKKSCEDHNCDCSNAMIRIDAMAFIMFIVTVWSAVGNWLLKVPWWVYLIIWILFCGSAIGVRNKCWCNKK